MRIMVVATRSLGATSTLAGAMHDCTISFIRQQSRERAGRRGPCVARESGGLSARPHGIALDACLPENVRERGENGRGFDMIKYHLRVDAQHP